MGGGRELRELMSSFVCVVGILLDELAAPREERGKPGGLYEAKLSTQPSAKNRAQKLNGQ